MTKTKATIITATFNLIESGRKDTFIQCIESIHNQTYKNIEHIVIDGASTDGTLDLLKEYAQKGWFTYISEPDKGIYDAMNKGIQKATGDYIAFINSDDYYCSRDAVKDSMQALDKENADFSYANAYILRGSKMEDWIGTLSKVPFSNFPCHQTMFVRTSVLKKFGGFDTQRVELADNIVTLKLISENYKSVYLDKFIIHFRAGGFSANLQEKVIKIYPEIFTKLLGKKYGLTQEDAQHLINHTYTHEITQSKTFSIEDALKLGSKLPFDSWRVQYFNMLYQKCFRSLPSETLPPFINVTCEYELFGKIPFLTRKETKKHTKYKLFKVIPLLKFTHTEKVISLKLFGFIPLIKIKKKKA